MDSKTITKRQKKQKFREQKYKKAFGSKKEGLGFAEFKKQKAIYQYNKLLRKEEAKEKYRTQNEPSKSIPSTKLKADLAEPDKPKQKRQKKLNTIQKNQKKLQEIAQQKEKAKKDAAVMQKAKSEAIAKYQTKKKEKYKLMCKKNFRGQPKVAGQMEILLKQIEASKKT